MRKGINTIFRDVVALIGNLTTEMGNHRGNNKILGWTGWGIWDFILSILISCYFPFFPTRKILSYTKEFFLCG
jgi:hypothetical protein